MKTLLAPSDIQTFNEKQRNKELSPTQKFIIKNPDETWFSCYTVNTLDKYFDTNPSHLSTHLIQIGRCIA